jgi:DNA-binding CsgD family transcriptional regulator
MSYIHSDETVAKVKSLYLELRSLKATAVCLNLAPSTVWHMIHRDRKIVITKAVPRDDQVDEIRALMRRGWSDSQIGQRLGRSASSIRWTRERFDLGFRRGYRKFERGGKLTLAEQDERFRQALGAGSFPSYDVPSHGVARIDHPATPVATVSSAADAAGE